MDVAHLRGIAAVAVKSGAGYILRRIGVLINAGGIIFLTLFFAVIIIVVIDINLRVDALLAKLWSESLFDEVARFGPLHYHGC